jgi:hypothetical protein
MGNAGKARGKSTGTPLQWCPAGTFILYDGMAESAQVAITWWQTSHVAEPLSRAGRLKVTRYSVPQWGQVNSLLVSRVIRTISQRARCLTASISKH